MTCSFCRRAFGLEWLCVCETRAAVQLGQEMIEKRLQHRLFEDDPDTWYAAEVERMRERAPA